MGPIKHKALLNVDLGEGFGNLKCGPDKDLLPLIDIANVACGFHSGDPLIMGETVRLCKEHGVKVGAHPGLPDLQGFGRREMKMQPEELTAITVYQVGALKGFLDREGLPLNHVKVGKYCHAHEGGFNRPVRRLLSNVKPHGVLYGMMCRDYEVAAAVIKGIPKGIPVFGLAGTNMEMAAIDLGVEFWAELYGDVKYNADGMLVIDRIKKCAWRTVSWRFLANMHTDLGDWKMSKNTSSSNSLVSL